MKRLTDTAIWSKPWFRRLTPAEKCAWCYITDACDNVGVWDADTELADFCIGESVDWSTFPDKLNGNVTLLDNGKWWIHDFCRFQHGDMAEGKENNAIKSYISLLQNHGLWDAYVRGTSAPAVPLACPAPGALGKGKGTGKGKGKGTGKGVLTESDKTLYHSIKAASESQIGEWDGEMCKREGPAAKRLITKAHHYMPDDPEAFVKLCFDQFVWLRDTKRHKLFQDKPCVPSLIASTGLWPHMLESMRQKAEIPNLENIPL